MALAVADQLEVGIGQRRARLTRPPDLDARIEQLQAPHGEHPREEGVRIGATADVRGRRPGAGGQRGRVQREAEQLHAARVIHRHLELEARERQALDAKRQPRRPGRQREVDVGLGEAHGLAPRRDRADLEVQQTQPRTQPVPLDIEAADGHGRVDVGRQPLLERVAINRTAAAARGAARSAAPQPRSARARLRHRPSAGSP
ncbi:MAG: hypothetical protein U5K43_07990 [Halofilum sp. (in: g-proteobacteria)]|nr:hypothetical protein [Halofilum sp. (in: g-proteobacteria)]